MSESSDTVDRLERLRLRPRTALKAGLVRAVMVQSGDLEDKIRRIEMIDLMPEEEPEPPKAKRGVLLRPAKTPEPPLPSPGVNPELAEPQRVEHYRRKLAIVPLRAGFWAYLTKEFANLVQFGARTSTLSRGWFPFTLKLSPESLAFLTKTLKTLVLPPLLQTLPTVLRKSWLHLTKAEYNLLAALQHLARSAGAVVVLPGDKLGGGAAWDPVIPCLRLFWTSPGLVEKTIGAWELATTKLNLVEKTRQAGTESIRTLLAERTDGLSLPDVLLALLMLRARRQVSWDEKASEPGEYFLRDSFDCTPEVQLEIDKAVEVLSNQLDALIREHQEVSRIRYFLPDHDVLAEFVGDVARDDRVAWSLSFLPHLDAAFSPLLEGQVVFADGSRTQLFQNPSLSSILARLRLLETQLADPAQAAQIDIAESVAKVVMNLGKTLVVLIRNRSMTADPLARGPLNEQPTDPLPQENSVLDGPPAWAGLSVIQALVKAARVCLQAGRVLGETSLESSLEKEQSLPGRAEEILVRLGRLVPQAKIEGLRARWTSQTTLEKPSLAE